MNIRSYHAQIEWLRNELAQTRPQAEGRKNMLLNILAVVEDAQRAATEPPSAWPSPTEAMLQDGARAYDHHLDHARPGPRAQAEAMSAAWKAMGDAFFAARPGVPPHRAGTSRPDDAWYRRKIEASGDSGPDTIGPPPALLDDMVNRFLAWPLPESVCADPCATVQGAPHRIGTNLLTADEARAMLAHVLTVHRALPSDDTRCLCYPGRHCVGCPAKDESNREGGGT